jgi:hypothetical protein
MNERFNEKGSAPPLFGMDQEFITLRKFYTNYKFSETRLFTGDSNKSIFYKIENRIWYYKQNKKWKLFYDHDRKNGGFIKLFGLRYIIKFKGEVVIRNSTLHRISLLPVSVSQSHSLEYYFNPLKGVVIIKSSNGIILLRSDSFNTQLTEDEIKLL